MSSLLPAVIALLDLLLLGFLGLAGLGQGDNLKIIKDLNIMLVRVILHLTKEGRVQECLSGISRVHWRVAHLEMVLLGFAFVELVDHRVGSRDILDSWEGNLVQC